MRVQTYPIHPALKPFIRMAMSVDGFFPDQRPQNISSKGEAALFFPYRSPTQWNLTSQKAYYESGSISLDRALLVGQTNTYCTLAFEGSVSYIVLPLTTMGYYHFAKGSTRSITNCLFSIETIQGSSLYRTLADRLWGVKDAGSAYKLIESYLIHYYTNIPLRFHSTNIQHITNAIEKSRGLIPINKLATKFRLSPRRMEQLFAEQVGLSPKQLSKVIRFRSLVQRIHMQPQTSLMQIVADYNFTDESHLIRDFKQLLNITPTLYNENKPLFDQIAFNNVF